MYVMSHTPRGIAKHTFVWLSSCSHMTCQLTPLYGFVHGVSLHLVYVHRRAWAQTVSDGGNTCPWAHYVECTICLCIHVFWYMT